MVGFIKRIGKLLRLGNFQEKETFWGMTKHVYVMNVWDLENLRERGNQEERAP